VAVRTRLVYLLTPTDRATLPHAQSTIALYYCRLLTARTMHVCHRPVAARCCQHQTACCRCLYRTTDGRCAVAKFSSVQSLGKSSRRKYPYFWRYSNFSKPQRSIGRGRDLEGTSLPKKSGRSVQPFTHSSTTQLIPALP